MSAEWKGHDFSEFCTNCSVCGEIWKPWPLLKRCQNVLDQKSNIRKLRDAFRWARRNKFADIMDDCMAAYKSAATIPYAVTLIKRHRDRMAPPIDGEK